MSSPSTSMTSISSCGLGAGVSPHRGSPRRSPGPAGFPFAELGKFNDVEFQEVQQSNDVVPSMVYVLDVSTSMGGSRLNFVKEVAARRVNDLNDGSLNLGIVTFSTSASTKQEMSLVNDITKNHSLDAIDKLYASGYTCIGCGLLEALNVLKQANVSSKGATVMLMSDGNENQQPRIADVLGNMTSTGVVVNTLAVGADADHGLEKLAHDTGGIAFSFKDPDGTFFPEVDAIFAVSTTAQLDEAERPVMIMNAQVSFGGALKITFHLDEELGNGTVVYVVRERKGTATTNASLIDPAHTVCHKCHSYSSKGTGETKINIPSPAMPGNWTLVLSGPSGEVVRASIRVESRMRDSSVEPVRLKCTVSRVVRSPKQARIYAHVTKGVAIVLDANVEAEVLTPTKTHAVPVQLYDDGLGADNAADDGIYSGTFVNFDGPGRYSVTARATSSELTRLEYISRNSSTLPFSSAKEYQLGSAEYTTPNPRRSARSRRSAPLLQVERFAVGGSFQVTTELNEMSVPPGNIRDLRVIDSSRLCNGTLSVRLSWTWPGGHLDTGTVESVQLRTSASYTSLLNAFEDQNLLTEANVLHGDLLPRPPRTSHRVEVALPAPIVEIHEGKDQTRKVYLSAVVVNEFGLMSDMSSVVVVSSAWNEQELSSQNESPFLFNKILLGLAIAGFATALVSFIALAIWCKRKQGSRNPEPKKHNCDQEC
ncbi:calcium-activated chloride channel regulator 1 [Dermacentor silvarum]|uniref:calcium-activated chloride channel regulator 1 n=1 Tax=Dermacentor silvarum TaxID=543639 RepID=UPI002100DA5B|nr:calcium-activated chloride channel regulator 1 [Dermacentor silvarum]